MLICKTWKQRSCRAWNPISRVSLRPDLKGQLSLSTGCRFTKFSKRRRRSWWILSSWAHTAVPACSTCSWAAWQKKSYVWRHAQCSSRASLPLCQYRKGRIVMTFAHVLVLADFSEPATQALRYALEEATLHHAKVTLLHVMPPHTGIEVYFITGAPGTEAGFDPVMGGRFGT